MNVTLCYDFMFVKSDRTEVTVSEILWLTRKIWLESFTIKSTVSQSPFSLHVTISSNTANIKVINTCELPPTCYIEPLLRCRNRKSRHWALWAVACWSYFLTDRCWELWPHTTSQKSCPHRGVILILLVRSLHSNKRNHINKTASKFYFLFWWHWAISFIPPSLHWNWYRPSNLTIFQSIYTVYL